MTPKERSNKEKRRITEMLPSDKCYPYIQDAESLPFLLFLRSETKYFVLPNPTKKFFWDQYSLREVVYTRVMNVELGRNMFHRNTHEKYAKMYKKENKVPPEDSQYLDTG